MTEQEVLDALQLELGVDIAAEIIDDAYTRILAKTASETGWSLPVSGNFKEYWFVERAKRHALYHLCTTVAPDFKYKQISLHQVWEHYWEMIKQADEDFKQAIEDNPAEFPIDASYMSFGTYITAGFKYDKYGNDVTYGDNNEVEFFPTDDD